MSTIEHLTHSYEESEAQSAQAMEHLVGTRGFGGLLGQLAENAAALTRLGTDAMDLALRNLRLAGRRDVVRLSRQLARTEDKLERVLQEVEELRAELAEPRNERRAPTKSREATKSRGPTNGSRAKR